MKIKILIANIIALLIIMFSSVAFAATGTVEFKTNTNEVKKGEEFTVTISASSEDGINGIDTTYSYDTEKLELISEGIVDTTKWSSLGTSPSITVICNTSESIKSADLYTIKFKVKDGVSIGDKIIVQTTEIVLDTDAPQTDSDILNPSKKVEVTVKGDSDEDKKNNTTDNSYKNEGESAPHISTEVTNAKVSNDNDKLDSTSVNGQLPKTGENFIKLAIVIFIITILSIIFFKKYIKNKDIK